MGPAPGLAEAQDCSARCSCRDKATLLPPGPASQQPMCEHGKGVEIKPLSVNTWKVSDDVRVRGQPAWFVAALYILHSLLPDYDPNINKLEHFCHRFVFLWCLVLISFSNVTCRECKKKKADKWIQNSKLFQDPSFFDCEFSTNLCQNSLTSFICYFVWLQRSVCTHLPCMLWLSAHDRQLFLTSLPSIMCSFLTFFFNSQCVFLSFANKCLFKTQVVRFHPR